jgi:hypothetical protein
MFEELNLLIALAIVQMMPADIAAAMPDEDLSALMVSVFERKYDITGDGWSPYSVDVSTVRRHLTLETWGTEDAAAH